MQVLLIQPPYLHPAEDIPSPPWNLVCLHSYLQHRTGHQSIILDMRLFDEWTAIVDRYARAHPHDLVAVVHAPLEQAAAARAMVGTLAQRAPHALRVVCGAAASLNPSACAAWPGAQAVLAGDAEPLLRNLLDHWRHPARLQNMPGMAMAGGATEPAWLPDLHIIPTPAWDTVPWNDYIEHQRGGVTALLRISRGHSKELFDLPWNGGSEPLRLWDMNKLAAAVGKCAHRGVTETVIHDPPGLWTPDRLRAWCAALDAAHNTHPWSIHVAPRLFSPAETTAMLQAGCRRLEVILPSSRPEILARYGIRGEVSALHTALRTMHQSGLDVIVRCWLGGPGEEAGERQRWLKLLSGIGYPRFTAEPFPMLLDAPLLRESWLPDKDRATDTWWQQLGAETPPPWAWGGTAGYERALAMDIDLDRTLNFSWQHRVRRFWQR